MGYFLESKTGNFLRFWVKGVRWLGRRTLNPEVAGSSPALIT